MVLPEERSWLPAIQASAARLGKHLELLEVAELPISDYNKRYLGKHLGNTRRTLEKYAFLMAWSLSGFVGPLQDFVFVEYGGGCGVLSLLAKQIGIGTVIYNDIYDVSCRDAMTIAEVIGLRAESYICGELDEVLRHLNAHQLSCQAIASYDVIEHIYDIESFLGSLRHLSASRLSVVMASGANPHNPWIRRKLTEGHVAAEYQDREYQWGHKERDNLRAYLHIRRDIILEHAPELPANELDCLAQATRGLIKRDIQQVVDDYRSGKGLTYAPDHPTNTCDPYTGNWAEHLLDLSNLEQVLLDAGFDAELLCGYWGSPKAYHQRTVARALDFAISRLGQRGLFLSPYYVLYGQRS